MKPLVLKESSLETIQGTEKLKNLEETRSFSFFEDFYFGSSYWGTGAISDSHFVRFAVARNKLFYRTSGQEESSVLLTYFDVFCC